MKLTIFFSVLTVVGLVGALPPAAELLPAEEITPVEQPLDEGSPAEEFALVDENSPIIEEAPVYLEVFDNGIEAVGRSNILLHSASVSMAAVANTVRTLNWSWRGAASRRISSWRAVVVGQSATITRTAGGVGTNHLSLQIRSGVGRGFSYRLEIYGR